MKKILIGASINDCRINATIDRNWTRKNQMIVINDKGEDVKIIDTLDVDYNVRGYDKIGVYFTPRGLQGISQRDWDMLRCYYAQGRVIFMEQF